VSVFYCNNYFINRVLFSIISFPNILLLLSHPKSSFQSTSERPSQLRFVDQQLSICQLLFDTIGEQAMKVFRLSGDEMELTWNNGGGACMSRKERAARDKNITVSIVASEPLASDGSPGEFNVTL
jgi:hypothetical protein